MKILCLIDTLAPGGAERQMTYLAAGLKESGHEVTLMAFSDVKSEFYRDWLKGHGIIPEFHPECSNKIMRPLRLAKLVKRIKPDVVVVYKNSATIAACLSRILTRFKLVVSERNTTQVVNIKEKVKFWLYRRADAIVPNSKSQGEFIAKHYPNLTEHTTVIRNMIDTDLFAPASHQIVNPIPVVLTTARVAEQKNVLNYLKAIRLLKERGIKAKFQWYGYHGDKDGYYSKVKQEINRLDITDIIKINKPSSKVSELYRKADIFCLPSIYEGFPNVLCEAMSSGLPVVASNICDNPDIVVDGENGFLFNPLDVEEMANAIQRALELTQDQRKEIGCKNRQRIQRLCSKEAFIGSYENIFKSICFQKAESI